MPNANLKVLISANARKFTSELKTAQGASKAFGLALVAGALLAGKAMLSGTLAAAKFGDEIDKLSRRTGLSAREVQELQVAAELGGATMANVEKAVNRLAVNMFDLELGTKTAKDAFGALGISMEDLESKSTADRLVLVLSKLNDMTDAGKKSAVALKLLGKSGAALIPLAEELDAARKAASGKISFLTDKQVKDAAAFTDQMALLKAQLMGFSNIFFADMLKEAIPQMQKFGDVLKEMRDNDTLKFLVDSIKQIVSGLIKITKAMTTLTRMSFEGIGSVLGKAFEIGAVAIGGATRGAEGKSTDPARKEALALNRRIAESNEKIAAGNIG